MASRLSKHDPILILGAGTFGLATAHSLALAGHKNITVLDRDDRIPSRFSGAFDINKIIRAEYVDPFYTKYALAAIRKWQTDALYQPHFRQVGFMNVVSGAASPVIQGALAKYLASVASNPNFKDFIIPCPDSKTIKSLVSQWDGELPGWNGYLNRLAGYAHSSNALQAVYNACIRLGVKFQLGPDKGQAVELLYTPGFQTCTGVRTRDGTVVRAKTTVIALGAAVGSLLPSIGSQVVGRCWGVAHIQLTPEESETLRGMPVANVRDKGFFFEPDPATHKLKICHMGGGYTNFGGAGSLVSLPYPSLEESDYILAEDEKHMRQLLREAVPRFADRPLIDAHLCWFADTGDSDYVIDYAPGSGGSVVVLSGDSGHGFKMLPVFGDLVLDLLQAGSQSIKRWRWKHAGDGPEHIIWRASKTQDLGEVVRARL